MGSYDSILNSEHTNQPMETPIKKPNITIRYGASNDDITVDGHHFDLSKMDRADRAKLKRGVVLGVRQYLAVTKWGTA